MNHARAHVTKPQISKGVRAEREGDEATRKHGRNRRQLLAMHYW